MTRFTLFNHCPESPESSPISPAIIEVTILWLGCTPLKKLWIGKTSKTLFFGGKTKIKTTFNNTTIPHFHLSLASVFLNSLSIAHKMLQ